MTQVTPRADNRTVCQTPIQYALLNTERFHPSRACNYSHDGLCYEATQPLDTESEVCIVMDNYMPGRPGPEGYRSYLARIRWIHLLDDRYAAGAQILARSHDILATEEQLPKRLCDLCGTLHPAHRLEAQSNGIQLCRQCSRHLHHIPSPKIRQCVERYLLGNVI